MMKYLSGLLFAVIVFLMVPISSVFAAPIPGNLLVGSYYGNSPVPDIPNSVTYPNLISTGYEVDGNDSTANPAYSNAFWYYFDLNSVPSTIRSVRFFASTDVTLAFYDGISNTRLSTYTIAANDSSYHSINVPNVKKVAFNLIAEGTVKGNIYEWYVSNAVQIPSMPLGLTATAGNAQVTLSWTAVTGATGYNIKRSTTAGGPYTTVATNVYGSPYTDTTVTNGTTYYYVVTAVNSGGESGNSNEASATPQGTVTPPTGNRALLVITLVSGLEKEYDLSMTEVNSFTTWYAARAAGTGAEVYTINKSFNKASFLTRKDNIAFNKIELYEVNEYTPAP
ncbi:fibronectin type III domain-containing protein [Paenibacillus baimaensis]|uniref:hypothetical protein n=1 Tax=Paenibacillus baimaensis TaxID=2982185 RepID=UPI00293E8E12|nr:hypothetical protein [Paenibacillus sp. WQ 127069]